MKKRILSLFCVLALCLGLLPTTALAADGIDLYVGGQLITESGCYENQNGTWTKVDGAEPASGQFYYDADTITLTLNQAEITHDQTVTVAEGYTYEGSVIAFSQTADVSLKIVVSQGTSTITGTGGIRVESTTGNASLSIKGSGSLDVEPKGSNSGITLCSSKNTNLDIDGADVTASSPAQYGVYLISSTDATSTSTITVNNGSLTTGGNGNVGIYYYWSGTSNAGTSSLTVSGNAVVDTRNSRILTNNEETGVQVGAGSDGNGGIVFDGTKGTVYGDVTLDDPLTVGAGETLTIPVGSTLTVPEGATLTNDGTINNSGTLTNNGTVTNNGTLTNDGTVNVESGSNLTNNGSLTNNGNGTINNSGTLTTESGTLINDGTINVEEGGTLTGEPTGGNGTVEYKVTGVTLNQSAISLTVGGNETLIPTITPENATNKNLTWASDAENIATVDTTGKVTAVAPGTANITVTTEDGGFTATCAVTVTQPVTGVKLDTDKLDLFTGESKTLTAKVEPADAANQDVTWSSNNNAVATVENGTVKAVGEGEATITVTTAEGSYTATCAVKVTDPVYSMTTDLATLDFAATYTGYDRPTAKTVTITNTGNQTLTLEQPVSTNSFEVGTLSDTQLAPDEKATFTVQPKADLAVGSYEETINISGSNGNNKVSTSVDATFAVVDINDTKVDNKLTITSGISAGIPGTAFDTADKVKAELTRVLVQDAAYTAGNTAFYDVKLQYSLDGGKTWFEATEATFPKEGITVTLPYPSGTDKNNYDYRVVHMFTVTSTRLGTTAGNTETPAVTKTDSGLQVTLKGLSPVVIGWDKIETPSSGGSTTPAATATPAPSDNITYYTCPSCGYHNWTATEAGYRCDNCGYLESTRQLSGYGNVKGTYTPGSGATSTAVSTVPQTGDESNPVLWTVLLLVSGLALGGLAIAKRKKQQ